MAIDWTKIYKKYKGLWVALEKDEKTVLASGKTVKEALEKARKTGYKRPIMLRVPTIVGFSYDIAKHGFGILGQRGFFDKFAVKFDLSKEEIELKAR